MKMPLKVGTRRVGKNESFVPFCTGKLRNCSKGAQYILATPRSGRTCDFEVFSVSNLYINKQSFHTCLSKAFCNKTETLAWHQEAFASYLTFEKPFRGFLTKGTDIRTDSSLFHFFIEEEEVPNEDAIIFRPKRKLALCIGMYNSKCTNMFRQPTLQFFETIINMFKWCRWYGCAIYKEQFPSASWKRYVCQQNEDLHWAVRYCDWHCLFVDLFHKCRKMIWLCCTFLGMVRNICDKVCTL